MTHTPDEEGVAIVSEREYYYEDEIDLRELVRTLIAGFTIGAGLLALDVSMMLPKQYEATAIVALTKRHSI